jgi:hypothetical protein
MKRREGLAAGEMRAQLAGIAVELAYVLGLSALGCLACALAFLLVR